MTLDTTLKTYTKYNNSPKGKKRTKKYFENNRRGVDTRNLCGESYCVVCGNYTNIVSKGRCSRCYQREYYINNRSKRKTNK